VERPPIRWDRTTIAAGLKVAAGRMSGAKRLRQRGDTVAALVLLREAALLLARAVVGAEGAPDEPRSSPRRTMDRLDEAVARTGRHLPIELERQRSLIASDDPQATDALGVEERERAADDLEISTDWLSHLLDAPSAERAKKWRALHLAAAGVVLLVVLERAWTPFVTPRNLALHCDVRASSESYSTTAAGAVDGIRYGQLGFHSAEESHPWLQLDLGRRYAISRVAAYGRADCCFDQSTPLAFEVSDDGVTYSQVAQRDEPFSQPDPWVIKPRQLTARFVRFQTLRRSFLVLSEVEVYGRAP
jgi:hypothetical protein